MNILLIGGTGVLSSAVTAEALKKGMTVTMINRGNRKAPEGVEVILSDHNKFDYIAAQLNGRQFDAVIDFLCYTKADVEGSFKLYRQFTRQYFFISSCAVYNTKLPGVKTEDCEKVLDCWDYSREKWECEQALTAMAAQTDCHCTIVRPGVTYGDTRLPYGIAPRYGYHWTMCARILAGKPILRWNGGENRCNMMRVEDFAVGMVGLIGNEQAYDEAYNICGDEVHSFNEVLSAMSQVLGKEVITVDVTPEFYAEHLPERAGEIVGGRAIDAVYSNEKIKAAVPDFCQHIPLNAGVEKTISAYKNKNYQRGIDWKFEAVTDLIIEAWCKQQHTDPAQYNTRFTDYLGNATLKDKLRYWVVKHRENAIISLIFKMSKH